MSSNLIGLAIALFVVIGFVAMARRKQQLARARRQIEGDAASHGMGYTAPGGAPPDVGGVAEGTHRFSGDTHGILWTLEAVQLSNRDIDSGSHSSRTVSKRYTRWTSPSCATRDGAYLLLMDLPDNVDKEKLLATGTAKGGGGFLASIANKVGGMLLGFFVRLYFGADQAQGTPLDPAHRTALPPGRLAQDYIAYASDPTLAVRLLTAEIAEFIIAERPDQLSFLINTRGIAAACPTFRIEPAQVAAFAEFCANLAARIRATGTVSR